MTVCSAAATIAHGPRFAIEDSGEEEEQENGQQAALHLVLPTLCYFCYDISSFAKTIL